jgi:hypothetical protein
MGRKYGTIIEELEKGSMDLYALSS